MRSDQGHVKQIGDGLYKVVVEFPRHEDGRRNQVKRHVRGTKKDANNKKIELLIQAGEDVRSELTLEQYIKNVFLPAKKKEVKFTTYETYEDRARVHIYDEIGDIKLVDLTPHIIRKWVGEAKTPQMQKERRRLLKTICQNAVYDDHLKSNPVDRVKPPKTPKYSPEVLTAHECATYLEHFYGRRSEAAVLIAMGCGLRRSEMAALTVSDINMETGLITVKKALLTARGGARMGTPKTDESTRTVTMPEPLMERLEEIMATDGPVCRNLDGSAMSPDHITHLYEKERDELPEGVKRISLKNLRHTSLTLAYDATGDLEAAKERAGHSNIAITAHYYVRPSGERDIYAAEKMALKFAEIMPKP